MKKWTYILFDLDGTLTDPYEGITKCVQYALEAFGFPGEPQEKLKKFIGPPLKEAFMDFYGFDDASANAAVEKYRERFTDIGIFENTLYDGIAQMLAALKADGRKLGVASSKPEVFVERILEHFHIRQYFDYVAGSFLDGRRTDKSEVIEAALLGLKVSDRDDVVMVGDRWHDVAGALKSGLACIGVAFGYGGREELTNAGALAVADSVGELTDFLLS